MIKLTSTFLFFAIPTAVALTSARAQIPTFAAADLVIGQTDFTSDDAPTPPNAASLAFPSGVAIDPTSGRLFVAERSNNRILRYATAASLLNGASAEAVFGQANFSDNTMNPGGISAATLANPAGLTVDDAGRLFVVDTGNHRVLMFEDASLRGSGASADRVFGQPGFTTGSSGTTATSMGSPFGVCIDADGNLWVSQAGNDRILRFANAATRPEVAGAAADQVLGQSTFTGQGFGLSITKFNNPTGIFVDAAGTLWVADSLNSRIVGFSNAAALGNGAPADRLFGQPDFDTSVAATSMTGMRTPRGLMIDKFGALWVSDETDDRVLRFDNASSLGVQPPASAVLGQPDFESSGNGLAANAFKLSFASSLFLDSAGNAWLSDNSNNRVLRFTRPPAPPAPIADTDRPAIRVRGRRTIETLRKRVVFRGTASDASGVAEINVKTQRGAKLKKIRGTTRWKAVFRVTKASGRVIVKFRSVDTTGKRSRVSRVRILRR